MTTKQISGAPWKLNQQSVWQTDENATLDNYTNIADVIVGGLTVKLPPTPQVGQRHRIVASGGDVTVDGNGHVITGDGDSIGEGTSRDYTFSTTNTWVPSGCQPAFIADYVLVGLGTAGSPLARYLSEDLKTSVLVIEAGENLTSDPQVLVGYPATPSVLTTDQRYSIIRGEYPGGAPDFNVPAGAPAVVPPGVTLALKQIWAYTDGKMWGGTSGHNGILAFRSSPFVFDTWALASGSAQWNYANILPYLKAAETFVPNPGGPPFNPLQRGSTGPIVQTSSGRLPVNSAYAAAALATGVTNQATTNFDYHDPTNVLGGILGVSAYQRFIRTAVVPVNGVYSPVSAVFRSWATDFMPIGTIIDANGNGLGGRKLKILSKAWATKVNIEPVSGVLTATGVQFAYEDDKEKLFVAVAKKKVILCAGSNVNPQLLQLSGVGPAALLTSLDIPVLVDSPKCGMEKENHYGPGALLDMTPQALPPPPATQGPVTTLTFDLGRFFVMTDGSNAGVLPAGVTQGIGQAFDGVKRVQMTISVGNAAVPVEVRNVLNLIRPIPSAANTLQINTFMLRPNKLGSVQIVSKDPFTAPRLVSGFYQDGTPPGVYDPAVYTDIRRAVDILRQIANFSLLWTGKMPVYPPQEFYPAAEYPLGGVPGALGSAASVALLVAAAKATSLVAAYHSSGTCRMGTNITNGVVDGNLDVFGVKGLSCCDCSVTPQIQDGNTAHAMYALGLRKAAIEGAVVPV